MSKKLVVVDSTTNKIELLDNIPSSGIHGIVDYYNQVLVPDQNGVVKLPNYSLYSDLESLSDAAIVSLSVNNNGDLNYNNGAGSGPYVLHLNHEYTHILRIRETDGNETWDYLIELKNTKSTPYAANANNFAIALSQKYETLPIPVTQITNGGVLDGKLSTAAKINMINLVPVWSFNDAANDVGTFQPAGDVVLVSDRVVDENGNVVS